jgi:tctex1 domain-containing protein 2
MKSLLPATLSSATWPESKDHERVKSWMKEIGERVKDRMLEIQSKGFKYMVLTQINENLGQGGRADMVSHWEDSDTVAREIFYNDSLICICIALAIRTY